MLFDPKTNILRGGSRAHLEQVGPKGMSLLNSKEACLPGPMSLLPGLGCYQGCKDAPAVRWVHVLQQCRMLGACGWVYQPAAAIHSQSCHHNNLGASLMISCRFATRSLAW